MISAIIALLEWRQKIMHRVQTVWWLGLTVWVNTACRKKITAQKCQSKLIGYCGVAYTYNQIASDV